MPIISEADKILIVILFHMGLDPRDIAKDMNLDIRTVKSLILRHAETGSVQSNHRNCGNHRVTSPEKDMEIILASIKNPFRTANDVMNLLDFDISHNTYRRRLNEVGLKARRAAHKESLTRIHKENRLNFANNYVNFSINNWYRTLMVDESTFCTSGYGDTLVRRPLGTRFDEQYLKFVQKSGRWSISVWGILTGDGIGPLVRIDGRFTAERYADILEDYSIP